jgi:phage repressor protein C with HTH and peptisase S24 domain
LIAISPGDRSEQARWPFSLRLRQEGRARPNAFNTSKRITPDGHARWPSTESVAKSLAATDTPIDVFVQLISDGGAVVIRQSIPIIGLSQAGKAGLFDAAGYPTSHGWNEIPFPAVTDQHMRSRFPEHSMEPAYRDDTLIVVSRAASIRRGDRMVAKPEAAR